MESLRTLIGRIESGQNKDAFNVTVVLNNGSRKLHQVRNQISAAVLGKSIQRVQEVPTSRAPTRPAGLELDR
jgi:hypothetical protein